MNKIKNLFFVLMMIFVVGMASCTKSDDGKLDPDIPEQGEGGDSEDEPEQTYDFAKLLCDGSRFIKREYNDFRSPVIGNYSAMTTQREYLFNKDGKGTLTTYVADKTPRGFTASTRSFTWTATDKKPVSLRVNISGGETFVMENAKIENNELTSTSEVMTKEQTVEGVLKKEDVVSYKVNLKYASTSDDYGRKCILMAPSKITVTTKTGQVSFVTHEYGTAAVLTGLPCWQQNGGPFNYYNSTVYAIVDTSMPYKYSFFQIYALKDKMPFVEKGKMYFHIGSFDAETGLSMIENNKEYTVGN